MTEFDKEVMWAVSGTGEDFRCVHVDFAREQQAEIERLRTALRRIRSLEEKNVLKYAQHIAREALTDEPSLPPDGAKNV